MRRLAPLACALALCACGGDLASPFSAVAVTFVVEKQTFKLSQVRLNTLTSLRHLRGCLQLDARGNCAPNMDFDVRAGGTVRVSTGASRAQGATIDALRAAFVTAQPARVNLSWNVLNDIVYAEDFDSLELLSTYYNLEKARKTIADWGLSSLPARPIVAHAALSDENGLPPLDDGELYYPPLATFFAPAATAQQKVPSALNLGAVAHAVGHQAVEELIWAGAPVPPPESGSDRAARHLARSLAEGIADYLGVAVSLDEHWFDNSKTREPASRALDQIRCSSPDMLDALLADDTQTPYDPYPLGSVFAGALWELGSPHPQEISRGVLAALPDLGNRAAAAQGVLTLPAILETLAAHAPDDQRSALCGIFLNRFAQVGLKQADLPSCAKATARQECQ